MKESKLRTSKKINRNSNYFTKEKISELYRLSLEVLKSSPFNIDDYIKRFSDTSNFDIDDIDFLIQLQYNIVEVQEKLNSKTEMTDESKGQYGVMLGAGFFDWGRAIIGNGETESYVWNAKKLQATDYDALYHIWDLWINDLMLNEKAAPAVLNSKDIGGGFETGKYGKALIGFWDIAEIHKVVQDYYEWDLIPLPTNETYGLWRTQMNAYALSISANRKMLLLSISNGHWKTEISRQILFHCRLIKKYPETLSS